ncbi:uncharacterized protein LOC127285663 [Leptopilina boulardi]|uniref:uncharacterized protein LOC127285663 n=1 Tax=Leptopilina boulardi TaxID=63433 RepID=UPI0021F544EA|nr:uncharacterized protein LOC127285663 [Leptopilina boulardi]
MRKLSMKGKRRKSETSDGESEENGVASGVSGVTRTSDNEMDETDSEKSETTSRKSKSNNKRRSSRSRGKQNESVDESADNESQEKPAGSEQENGTANSKGGSSKRRKKDEKPVEKEKPATDDENNEDDEYEVEKVVAQRTIKGRRQFLVRWKGYGEDSDTWEQEKDLNCPQLIEEFLAEAGDDDKEEKPAEKTPKSGKSKQGKKSSKKVKKDEETKGTEEEGDDNDNEDKEFEVEKIIEVHFKKNKSREFLIRWKGFSSSDDTWEPEENLNCPELIEKFMEKVEKAKKTEARELRTNPTLTKHFTLGAHGRRHSRRHGDKQRVTYRGCDE